MKLPREYLCLGIIETDDGNYLVSYLLRSGKHSETKGIYDDKRLLVLLEDIKNYARRGLIENNDLQFIVTPRKNGRAIFRDIGELIEALKLKQGVEVEL